MNKELLEQKRELLKRLLVEREKYADTLRSSGVLVPKNPTITAAEDKNIEAVVNAMKEAEKRQLKLIEAREIVLQKEELRINPTKKENSALKEAEERFLEAHNIFENMYNKAHIAKYYEFQKRASQISFQQDGYLIPIYNRDEIDEKIINLAREQNVCLKQECFAVTIQHTRYTKGDFGSKYLDSKLYTSQVEKDTLIDPSSNIEMLSVLIKDIKTNNKNVFVAFREPKSKEEQALINMKIKTAIVTNNEEMAMLYDEMKIEKALAEQELALMNEKLDLGKVAEEAYHLQLDIVNKRNDREILINCGMDLSKKELKIYNKQIDLLEKDFDHIDKRLDKILTFNKMDKEDYWQQIEVMGKERFKESFGTMTPPSLPDETLWETIQKARGQGDVIAYDPSTETIEEEELVQEEEVAVNVYRVKTDIVKKALAAERAKVKRELSPDPLSKTVTKEMNVPVVQAAEGGAN